MKKALSKRFVIFIAVLVGCCIIAGLICYAIPKLNGEQRTDKKQADSNLSPTSENMASPTEVVLATTELAVGFDSSGTKELPRQRIAYRCATFVPSGENLGVDVYVGDKSYTYGQEHNEEPSYDTYGVHGYPNLRIYKGNNNSGSFYAKKHDDKLLINGCLNEYQKVYTKEEMSSLELAYDEDVSEGKHEHVELDFSQYEVGSTGSVVFSFSWDLGEEPEKATDWYGHRQVLGFYVGENGVSVAETAEDAENNYTKNHLRDFRTIDNEDHACTSKEWYLFCENELEREYTHGEVIEKRYEFISSLEIDNCEVVVSKNDGVEIVEVSPVTDLDGKNCFSLKFRVNDAVTLGSIEFSVIPTFSNPDIAACNLSQTIYVCNIEQNDYVCLNYIDALADYSESIQEYLDEISRQGEYVEFIHSDSSSELSDAVRTTHAITGYIRWTDSAGNTHPAEGVTVQIYKGTPSSPSFSLIYTSTTTTTGYYGAYFSYDGSVALLKIRVLSSGTNINVVDSSNATYTYESGVSGASSDIVISYTASNSNHLGKSLSVHQGMALANRYIKTLENNYLNSINVRFYSSTGTSYYSSSQGLINVIIGDAFDWDVLEHEFGHYVQNVYGISNNPGLDHSSLDNLADTNNNKSVGIRLAWGEGWATYFSINLQNKMGASSMNIPRVGDTYYQDTEDSNISYDIEYLPTNRRKGEANEATVAAVLYDITDAVNTSEEDQIYVNNGTVWSITKNSGSKTLSDFINAFNASSSITKATKVKLGSTLSRYVVSAKVYSPSVSGNSVTFTWDKQGGSTTFPNNSFRLVFFDSSYNELYSTSYVNAASQSISLSQWNTMLGSSSVVYCCVQTRQTSSPTTGPYYSNTIATYSSK